MIGGGGKLPKGPEMTPILPVSGLHRAVNKGGTSGLGRVRLSSLTAPTRMLEKLRRPSGQQRSYPDRGLGQRHWPLQ